MSHSAIDPAILYWGTPVVLISTNNEDGSANIAPISSVFWLGDRAILGIAKHSQTAINLLRTRQACLNLPSDDMVSVVNALARTTGTNPPPAMKIKLGYRYEKDKFGAANLTPLKSDVVAPPRIKECPVHMEVDLVGKHEMMGDLPGEIRGFALAIEVRVLRCHVMDYLRLPGHKSRIDPDAWRPMIMSFQHLYGLRAKEEHSRLAQIDEELYRPATPRH